jgi:hypothetical protein
MGDKSSAKQHNASPNGFAGPKLSEILCSRPNQYGLSFVSLVIYRLAASVNLYLSLGVTCLMSGGIIITLGSCFVSRLLYKIVSSIS